jgi:hypothetical protein
MGQAVQAIHLHLPPPQIQIRSKEILAAEVLLQHLIMAQAVAVGRVLQELLQMALEEVAHLLMAGTVGVVQHQP